MCWIWDGLVRDKKSERGVLVGRVVVLMLGGGGALPSLCLVCCLASPTCSVWRRRRLLTEPPFSPATQGTEFTGATFSCRLASK